jgi:non-homologous end joining protein Ku
VIDLMEALKASVAAAKKPRDEPAAAPAKRKARSARS